MITTLYLLFLTVPPSQVDAQQMRTLEDARHAAEVAARAPTRKPNPFGDSIEQRAQVAIRAFLDRAAALSKP